MLFIWYRVGVLRRGADGTVLASSGGELMEAYRLGGGREVEKLLLDQFSVFLYNEGRGKEITRTEYLKWKLRGKTRDEVGG